MPFPCGNHRVEAQKMENRNCEKLFEYLRNILYDPKAANLEVEELDEPYQKLGMGLQYLEKAVKEMKEYAEALSRGKLSEQTPPRDNFLCENLKNIHANLSHLTWQAKQVAKGDYSQTVSYLGEFSEAFNTMTRQLREREETLKEEAEIEKQHAAMMENYNQLLMELIARSDEEILVIGVENQNVLYCNANENIHISPEEVYQLCLEQLERQQKKEDFGRDSYEWTWEAEDGEHHFYRITTGFMQWQGEKAYLHIIREVTDEKQREARLEAEAYLDQLTGVGNRYYFRKEMEELLESGESIVFCYCDLDHLKEINDQYGHLEGDGYIRYFVDTVKTHIRQGDIFARLGGDEFCMILRDCPKEYAERKIQRIQDMFQRKTTHPYDKNFSYGIVEVTGQHGKEELENILQRADAVMYDQKKEHKRRALKNGNDAK